MSEYEKYKALDDLPIVTKVWKTDEGTVRKGVIQIIHGMCETKERYEKVIKIFTGLGYICVISDLRGHGENVEFPKDLGYIGDDGMNLMIQDIRAVSVYIKNNFPDLPLILIGHSMGSLLARAYTKRYEEDIDMLVILGGPSINKLSYLGVALTELMMIFLDERNTSKLLDKMVLGRYSKKYESEGLANSWLCSDKKVVEAYNHNPKCGFPFTINGYNVLCKLMCEAYSTRGWTVKNPELPIFILSGADDPCINNNEDFTKSVNVMKKLGYKNVVYKLYKNMRHELFNESGYKKVVKDIMTKAPVA